MLHTATGAAGPWLIGTSTRDFAYRICSEPLVQPSLMGGACFILLEVDLPG